MDNCELLITNFSCEGKWWTCSWAALPSYKNQKWVT